MNLELKERKDCLCREMDHSIARSERLGRNTHWVAIVLMCGAITASFLAGLAGLSGALSTRTIGILSLIPGAIALFATQFKPQLRSSWHYRKANKFKALRSRLLYEQALDPDPEQIALIARDRAEMIERMQTEWDRLFGLHWHAFAEPTGRRKRDSA